jgi:hypothetical protein
MENLLLPDFLKDFISKDGYITSKKLMFFIKNSFKRFQK